MATRKVHGSCHCKKVKFEAEVDFSKGSSRCNCSFCAKVRNWSVIVKPAAFKLLTDPKDLGDYQFRQESPNHHYFCKSCGVRTHSKGYVEEIGGDYVSVVLAVLDDVSHADLAEIPIQFMDGLNNNWFNKPAVTKHL